MIFRGRFSWLRFREFRTKVRNEIVLVKMLYDYIRKIIFAIQSEVGNYSIKPAPIIINFNLITFAMAFCETQ